MLQTSHSTHPSTPTPVLTLRCRSNRNVGSCKQKKCFQSSPTNGCRYSLSPGQAPHQKFACLMFLPPPIANMVADLMAHEYEARHLPQLRSQTAKLTLSHMHWQWCCSLKIGMVEVQGLQAHRVVQDSLRESLTLPHFLRCKLQTI